MNAGVPPTLVAGARLKYYDLIAVAFVVVLLISNVIAQKLIAVGPFTFTAGILLFPFAYIFGDVLTEVYGYARTRRVIWMGFAANLLLAAFTAIAIAWPPAAGWPLQREFETALGLVPRIVAASVVGYWVGEFVNSYIMARMKVWSRGKRLWMRTIGSTLVGQAADTAVFILIAFAGVMPWNIIVAAAVSGWAFKVLYEAAATPLTYAIVGALKKAEGVDTFDRDTNFNPFKVEVG